MVKRLVTVALCLVVLAPAARAQSFEGALHITAAQWGEFDGTDVGIGGRFTWRPVSLVGVDAELDWYPSEFPSEAPAFSGNRFEGLFGVTVGPQLNRVRPFGKIAGGFLRSAEAPEPFACIAIFPPPLSCVMAAGQTLPAVELGGGIQFDAASRTFARVDVGARWLRYPGPSFRSFPSVAAADFWAAGLRLSIGGGLKF
jgi:hypothetical protein